MLMLALAAATARIALGQYGRWGAFREDRPAQCFAIAEPVNDRRTALRPYVAISNWPGRGIAAQVHVRLREARDGQQATVRIGVRRFPLQTIEADAWAPDARADIAIVAAMRRADSLIVEARDGQGRHYADRYPLAGAASAVDAAALGCLGR